MKKLFVILCSIIVLATSCTKEKSFEIETNSGEGTNTPTNENEANYLPTKKGTYLKYKITSNTPTLPDRVSTQIAQGKQEKKGDINCEVWQEQETGQLAYFFSKDHTFGVITSSKSPNTGVSFDLNFIYLNDTASVGYNWPGNLSSVEGMVAHNAG